MAGRGAELESALKTSIQAVHASSAPAATRSRPESSQNRGKGTPDPRHMTIALHHARQIQNRKDLELLILSHIETLMELPTAQNATADSPSAEDISTFFSALTCFQPSDYDNLILERNIDGSCGYTLCPKPRRKDNSRGGYRIVWGSKGSGPGGRGKEMKVVQKEKLEMWCSDQCAERAMYIKVQLSERPASERTGNGNRNFVLLDEARRADSAGSHTEQAGDSMRTMEENLQGLTLQGNSAYGQDHLSRELQELTMQDRGGPSINPHDQGNVASRQAGGLLASVVERDTDVSIYPDAPVFQPDSAAGGSVEGFHPRSDTQFRNWTHDRDRDQDEDGDEDMDDLLPQI